MEQRRKACDYEFNWNLMPLRRKWISFVYFHFDEINKYAFFCICIVLSRQLYFIIPFACVCTVWANNKPLRIFRKKWLTIAISFCWKHEPVWRNWDWYLLHYRMRSSIENGIVDFSFVASMLQHNDQSLFVWYVGVCSEFVNFAEIGNDWTHTNT